VRRQLLDADLEALGGEMRGRVLEVGTGRVRRRGRFRPPTALVERWLCVDIDRARMPDVQADVERLPIAPAVFDVVVCLEVLEYVDDPAAALCEMRRVLRPGGTLVLSMPFMHRGDSDHDYWRFTEPGLRHLLGQTGYRVVTIRAQGSALGVAVSVLKYALDRQPGATRWALGLVVRPLLRLVWHLDMRTAAREVRLATFSTGYLVVART
jgi:SAM-dependent methyltransferase